MAKKRSHPTRPDPPSIRGGGDRYEVLLALMEHEAAEAERRRAFEEEEEGRRRRRRSMIPRSVVVVLALITAWLWMFPPGLLRHQVPPPQPLAREEAVLRFTMYVQVQRIRAFEAERGRLPLTLEEAGPPLPSMEYTRLVPGLYQLTGTTDRLALTYRSDLPLDAFVGAGATVVEVGQFP